MRTAIFQSYRGGGMNPSGQVVVSSYTTPPRFAPVRFAPVKSAPMRLAPVRSALARFVLGEVCAGQIYRSYQRL